MYEPNIKYYMRIEFLMLSLLYLRSLFSSYRRLIPCIACTCSHTTVAPAIVTCARVALCSSSIACLAWHVRMLWSLFPHRLHTMLLSSSVAYLDLYLSLLFLGRPLPFTTRFGFVSRSNNTVSKITGLIFTAYSSWREQKQWMSSMYRVERKSASHSNFIRPYAQAWQQGTWYSCQ